MSGKHLREARHRIGQLEVQLADSQEGIERLTAENRALRTIVRDQQRRLDSRGPSSTRAPNGSAAGLEGDGPRVLSAEGSVSR